MHEHLSDEFVKKAQKEGYRSRAVYKLLEIVEKKAIIRNGNKVLDLGAAPGGWSQVAAKLVGSQGKVIASDILPLELIDGVDFLQGDFTEQSVYDDLLVMTDGAKVDVVLSDMAPNMSGQLSVDQPKSMYLAELAIEMAIKTLNPGGSFVVKVFQGDGFDVFVQNAKKAFKKVSVIKPKASRPRSKEVYLLASQLK
ncbi:23S rRNA methyltransferase [Candidatus Pseudothioglobus singularis PS1]|uniref:Ribosomal RNA large subunit methyltransferase E n=2 Tax=Candidatus Pseudothioglobus TaxID=2841677 RepID=A0A0M3T1T3_9GAMM|nr:23S rRNA methyltransferase [Candidatus Pseudothioglobus singularis PS1]